VSLGLISAVLTSACGSTTGSVQGHVLLVDPVRGPQRAGFTTTVELEAARRVVAEQRVAPQGTFHFTVTAGAYHLDVVGVRNCSGTLAVRAGQTVERNVTCVPAPAAG
jgi:hypothetical protein